MADPYNIVEPIMDALASHMLTLGRFERVNKHEPKSSPGTGITASIWMQALDPIPQASGLNATTARVELNVRIYTSAFSVSVEQADQLDPTLSAAAVALMASISSDFELGGLARGVDLLGAYGAPMGARAGYLEIDRNIQRVITVIVPVIVNDVWSQSP